MASATPRTVFVVLVCTAHEESTLLGVYANRYAAETDIRDKFVTYGMDRRNDQIVGDEAVIMEEQIRG